MGERPYHVYPAGKMQTTNTSEIVSPIPRLLSVGHSNHDLETFLALLRQAGVTAIADVRSHPYSGRLPHFSRPELERVLRASGIAYVFLGEELGGRPRDSGLYDEEGRVDYERVRATDLFQHGLDRLLVGTERYRVAMLCGEEDPLDCHRGLMVTPALGERGVFPGHLRKAGRIETTAEMEQQLLKATGMGAGELDGLFAAQMTDDDRREDLAGAYRRMARRKAYRLKPGGEPEGEG
jgi:Domain of unknown function DUF488